MIPHQSLSRSKKELKKYPCKQCEKDALILYEDGKCFDCTDCTSIEYRAAALKKNYWELKPLTPQQKKRNQQTRRIRKAKQK